MSELNVTVLVGCPACGRPSQGPVQGEVVTVEREGQLVPMESLEVRDDLICRFQYLVSLLRRGQPVPEFLTKRVNDGLIEYEKLRQADCRDKVPDPATYAPLETSADWGGPVHWQDDGERSWSGWPDRGAAENAL